MYDAVVIGGGFYGAAIAVYLKNVRGFSKVLLVEQESGLLKRASYNNQARVHNGCHYPRSFTTAFRSRVNLPRFMNDYADAVKTDFTKLYAIARNNSKVTAKQFERFCREIGAKLSPAPQKLTQLFEPRLVEQLFLVEEYAFNSLSLAAWATKALATAGIEVKLNTRVEGIKKSSNALTVTCGSSNDYIEVRSHFIFNCTYSGLNQFVGDFVGTVTKLKHEITEMALIQAPPELEGLGITLMDGPFFSMMPFPARGLHTLSHVRYTPHLSWTDELGTDPYLKLARYDKATRADRMLRDSGRYLPSILKSKYVDSLFEVKTILVKSEGDDGRPILFERHQNLPGCYSILGGKIDNIYDALERLDAEPLEIGKKYV